MILELSTHRFSDSWSSSKWETKMLFNFWIKEIMNLSSCHSQSILPSSTSLCSSQKPLPWSLQHTESITRHTTKKLWSTTTLSRELLKTTVSASLSQLKISLSSFRCIAKKITMSNSRKPRRLRSPIKSSWSFSRFVWDMTHLRLQSSYTHCSWHHQRTLIRKWWIFWWMLSETQSTFMKWSFSSCMNISMCSQFANWTNSSIFIKKSCITKNPNSTLLSISSTPSKFLCLSIEFASKLKKRRFILWLPSVLCLKTIWMVLWSNILKSRTTS